MPFRDYLARGLCNNCMFNNLPENPTTGASCYTGHGQYTTSPADLSMNPDQTFDKAHEILDKHLG